MTFSDPNASSLSPTGEDEVEDRVMLPDGSGYFADNVIVLNSDDEWPLPEGEPGRIIVAFVVLKSDLDPEVLSLMPDAVPRSETTVVIIDPKVCPSTAASLQIAALPSFVYYVSGNEVLRFSGSHPDKVRQFYNRAVLIRAALEAPAGS